MQADPDKWDDSELIAAVSRGLENLDAGAAAEDEDEMAAADARFAALLEAPVPATTPATAASPVKDPTVGEYGEWEPVQRPAAPPAATAPPPLPPAVPPAGPDAAGLPDVLARWYYAGYYLGRYHGEQEAAAAESKS